MLPYLLAAVGGYLIATSSKKILPNEATLAYGGELEDLDEYDERSRLEAVLKGLNQDFEYEIDADTDEYEYSAKTKVMTRFDLPFEIKFEVKMENDYDGLYYRYEIEIDEDDFDFEGLHKMGVINDMQYNKIKDFFKVLKRKGDMEYFEN